MDSHTSAGEILPPVSLHRFEVGSLLSRILESVLTANSVPMADTLTDELRDERLRGPSSQRLSVEQSDQSLYPHAKEPWQKGLAALGAAAVPFVTDFVQSKTSDVATDWFGFARLLRDVRRTIHRYPELGFKEFQTHAFLRRFCEDTLKIPTENVRTLATTGLVVDVAHGNKPIALGDAEFKLPVLAFRADMDGLPMEEASEHLPYCSVRRASVIAGHAKTKSQVSMSKPCAHCGATGSTTDGEEGVPVADAVVDGGNDAAGVAAHMCGHDGHTTTLLGFLALVVRQSHALPPGTFVRFLFQPAEEGPGGALPMIKEGVLEHVDEVYGLHNSPFPLYSLHVKPGPVLSHAMEFWIDIMGVGGHGSAPHTTVDPILVGAHVVTALHSIVSRSIAPTQTAVVSVTQFHGGEVTNVIPAQVRLAGSVRDFDETVGETIQRRIKEIAHSTCSAFGATAKVTFKDLYPVTVNHEEPARLVQRVAAETGLVVSEAGLPAMASEDFSYYLRERKGCFFMLGTKEADDVGNIRSPHSNGFDYNDKATPLGIRVYLGIVQNRLQCELLKSEELQKFQVAMERVLS
jgi:amidohydrolase